MNITYYCTNCGHVIESKTKLRAPGYEYKELAPFVYSYWAKCCGRKMVRKEFKA